MPDFVIESLGQDTSVLSQKYFEKESVRPEPASTELSAGFDIPAVRPESFDKAQDRLVEACGELRRTRDGCDAQDRLVEALTQIGL